MIMSAGGVAASLGRFDCLSITILDGVEPRKALDGDDEGATDPSLSVRLDTRRQHDRLRHWGRPVTTHSAAAGNSSTMSLSLLHALLVKAYLERARLVLEAMARRRGGVRTVSLLWESDISPLSCHAKHASHQRPRLGYSSTRSQRTISNRSMEPGYIQ